MSLNNPDFTTSARIEKVINQELGGKFATSKDSSTLDIVVPINYQDKIVHLLAIIENFKVNTDASAKIVINERTGSLVAGGDIILKPVAVAHGDLSIEVGGGEGGGKAKGAKPQRINYVDQKTTLNDLVQTLNSLGVAPEDLITIFQLLKRNGSLTADIELI